MKPLTFFLVLLFSASSIHAQSYYSEYGDWSPPSDTLRIFLVFAEVVNDPAYANYDPAWLPGQMPVDPGKYFDHSFDPINVIGLVTKYYHEASFGKFIVLGDYYDSLVQIDTTGDYPNWIKVAGYLDNLPGNDIITANGHHINGADFDHVSNYGFGTVKTFTADNRIDMFMVLFRVNSFIGSSNNSGEVVSNYTNIPVKDIIGQNSWSQFKSIGNNAEQVIRHEFGHTLYGTNQMHNGGGGAGRRTNMSSVGGWSNMSSFDSNSNGWNAYDRHRMGWENPAKQYLTSAFNASTSTEVTTDSITLATHPTGGEYVLRNFNTTGDAIRIKLPKVDTLAPPQFLWLENHSQTDLYDFSSGRQGLYAYIQIGKDNKKARYSNAALHPNNYTFPLPALGRYDFNYSLVDSTDSGTITLDTNYTNPFAGYHLLMRQALDLNHDGVINNYVTLDTTDKSELLLASPVYLPDTTLNYYPVFGSNTEAYKLSGNRRISVGTNPSTTPIHCWNFEGGFHSASIKENHKIHLSGLSVELLDENYQPSTYGTGAARVKVRWDEYNMENDVRWCDSILLHPSVHFNASNLPLDNSAEYALNLKTGKTIILDRGKSPTRHTSVVFNGENYFTDPTELHCLPNSYFHMEDNSTVIIRNGSTLTLESGSKLELHHGAVVVVEDGSKLIIEDGAEVLLHDGASIAVEVGGSLIYRNLDASKGITVGPTSSSPTAAEVRIKGNLVFENGSSFTYTGSGKYVFEGSDANVQFTDPTTSTVHIDGPGATHPVIRLEYATVDFSGVPVHLESGLLEVEGSGTVVSNNNDFYQHVFYAEGNNVSNQATALFELRGNLSIEVYHCRFNSLGGVLDRVYNVENIQSGGFASFVLSHFDNVTQAIAVSQAELVSLKGITLNNSTNAIPTITGFSFTNVKKVNFIAGVLSDATTGIYFDHVLGAYLSGTLIRRMVTGISGDVSQIFLRNGATIRDITYGVDLNGTIKNNTYTSMLTMGDEGCADIIYFEQNAIRGVDCLLNIDAWIHAFNNGSNTAHPNLFIRASHSLGTYIDLCYQNATQNQSIIPTVVMARGNHWDDVPLSMYSPDFFVRARATICQTVSNNYTTIPVKYAPVSVCEPVYDNCSTCDDDKPVGGDGGGGGHQIRSAFAARYNNFLPVDTQATREPFVDLSALPLELDTFTQQWKLTATDGSVYTLADSSVLRVMVAKVLHPANDSTARRADIKNIFEKEATKAAINGKRCALSPNPGKEGFEIKSVELWARTEVYSADKRLVYESNSTANRLSVSAHNWSSGIYTVKVYFADKVESYKWVKSIY